MTKRKEKTQEQKAIAELRIDNEKLMALLDYRIEEKRQLLHDQNIRINALERALAVVSGAVVAPPITKREVE
jgi:hypothetical protein